MSTTFKPDELNQFLVNAKIVTYASGGDEFTITPALDDSHQLEFADGKFLYRDVYYGGRHFIGMETVFQKAQPIWGMSYYGGVLPGSSESQIAGMPPFLKAALREIPLEAPFRGPKTFGKGEYLYKNKIQGDVIKFHGTETISFKGQQIYQLHYGGGIIE